MLRLSRNRPERALGGVAAPDPAGGPEPARPATGRPGRPGRAGGPRDAVRLVPGAEPANPLESLVAELLAGAARKGQTLARRDLENRLVDRMIREEVWSGWGWVCDVGLWGPSLLQQEARKALDELEGRLITSQPV